MTAREELHHVTVYVDGACYGNPGGPGGYGVILSCSGRQREIRGGFRRTTNNRMELCAVICGLEALTKRCRVQVVSDSTYVVDGMNKGWAKTWRSKEWYRGTELVPNWDLWDRLLRVTQRHEVSFEHVQGHRGHPENERCDQLAGAAARDSGLPVDLGYERPMPPSLMAGWIYSSGREVPRR